MTLVLPQYFLAALTIAKNESMVIEEYLQHCQSQGFEHVFLIDNGSTDDMVARIQPFIKSKFVTLFPLPEPSAQIKHYNTVYQAIRNRCVWLAVIDVDEYVYGTYARLADMLKREFAGYDKIHIPWLMFGSSGLRQQPASVRKSFTRRASQVSRVFKTVFRTNRIHQLAVHDHETDPTAERCLSIFAPYSQIRLNHYCIMSWEYFEKVKMTRGDVSDSNLNTHRTVEYFNSYDALSDRNDTTLARKVK